MRPRTTWPAEHQRERRLHGVRHPVGEQPLLERRDQLAQLVVAVDVGVGAARQLVGVEQVLLAEPRLDPGVEPGAEASGR